MFTFILLGLRISVNEDLQASLTEFIHDSRLRYPGEFFEEKWSFVLLPISLFR